jgi:NADPH-dependent curcumin reductase CurA
LNIGKPQPGETVVVAAASGAVAKSPPGQDRLPLLMPAILSKRLSFRGFIYFDYASQFPDFVSDMKAWLADGRIKYREDITDGLENAPRELIRLLKGENFGKKIIRVSPDPTETKRYIADQSDERPRSTDSPTP